MRRRLEFVAWMIFLLGSLLFAVNGFLAGDFFGAGASLTFSFGCILFITAFFIKDKD